MNIMIPLKEKDHEHQLYMHVGGYPILQMGECIWCQKYGRTSAIWQALMPNTRKEFPASCCLPAQN